MSKIFRISGNFKQSGKWSKPDPSFSGKIVVDEDGIFYGFCDELYSENIMSDLNRVRYLSGALGPNGFNGNQGIAFYKMSNYFPQNPLMYIVPDLICMDSGGWYALERGLNLFALKGMAKVSIEEEIYSEEEEASIRAKFELLDKGINCHYVLIEMARDYCKEVLLNAE